MRRNYFHRLIRKLIRRLIGLLWESLIVSLVLYLLLVLIKPEPQVGIVKGNCLFGSEPAEGVTMTLSKDGEVVASETTDAAGAFEFDPVAIGSYTLGAHKDVPEGYLTATSEIEVTGEGVVVPDLSLETDHLWCEPGTR
jgi:hypothetical protein